MLENGTDWYSTRSFCVNESSLAVVRHKMGYFTYATEHDSAAETHVTVINFDLISTTSYSEKIAYIP